MEKRKEDKTFLLNGISMQQIYLFLYAYESGNFSKVARKLYMTQATVSRMISNLEAELTFPLFLRNPTGVLPTPAADLLYIEWKKLLLDMENAYKKALFQAKEQREVLTIGDLSVLQKEEYLIPILRIFEKKYPEVDLKIRETNIDNCRDGLLEGRYDLVFSSSALFEGSDAHHVCTETILQSPMGISIYKNHPLYCQETITKEDLEKQVFIVPEKDKRPVLFGLIENFCKEYGIHPKHYYYYKEHDEGFLRFLMGKGLLFSNSQYDSIYNKDIRRLELENMPLGVIVAWLDTNFNPYVSKFILCVKEFQKSIIR